MTGTQPDSRLSWSRCDGATKVYLYPTKYRNFSRSRGLLRGHTQIEWGESATGQHESKIHAQTSLKASVNRAAKATGFGDEQELVTLVKSQEQISIDGGPTETVDVWLVNFQTDYNSEASLSSGDRLLEWELTCRGQGQLVAGAVVGVELPCQLYPSYRDGFSVYYRQSF